LSSFHTRRESPSFFFPSLFRWRGSRKVTLASPTRRSRFFLFPLFSFKHSTLAIFWQPTVALIPSFPLFKMNFSADGRISGFSDGLVCPPFLPPDQLAVESGGVRPRTRTLTPSEHHSGEDVSGRRRGLFFPLFLLHTTAGVSFFFGRCQLSPHPCEERVIGV